MNQALKIAAFCSLAVVLTLCVCEWYRTPVSPPVIHQVIDAKLTARGVVEALENIFTAELAAVKTEVRELRSEVEQQRQPAPEPIPEPQPTPLPSPAPACPRRTSSPCVVACYIVPVPVRVPCEHRLRFARRLFRGWRR